MILKIKKYIIVLPLIYLFISIFLARSKVQYVFLSVALLVISTFLLQLRYEQKKQIFLAQWMAVFAAIGLSAAVILSIEKVELLAQPSRIASCSLSPVVACSPVISSSQASAFGFPNSFIGIFGFTAVLTAAITIAAGANKLSKPWWRTLLGGIVFGAGLCIWLFHEGVFEIGKLCLYCLLVWLVTFSLLWMVVAYSIENKVINLGTKLNNLLTHKYELITVTFLIIFMLIFFRWSDYWTNLF